MLGGGSLVSLARGFGHCGMRVARCTPAPHSPWRSAPGAKGWELGHDQACAPPPLAEGTHGASWGLGGLGGRNPNPSPWIFAGA